MRKYSWFIVFLFALQTACAPMRPAHLTVPHKYHLGRIAVVVGNFDPIFNFDALTSGKGEGAAKGTIAGLAGCMVGAPAAGIGGVILAIICLPVGAVVGGVYGAGLMESSGGIEKAKSNLQSQMGSLALQERLRSTVEQYANNMKLNLTFLPYGAGPTTPDDTTVYQKFSDEFDTLIEIVALELIAQTSGEKNVPVSVQIKAKVRVINTKDGSIRDTFPVVSTRITQSVAQWLANDAKPVIDGIDAAIKEVAETSIDEVLLIYHPNKLTRPSKVLIPSYAIRPIEPPLRSKVYWRDKMTWGHLERFQLESLTPTFEWEDFPRGFDIDVGESLGEAQQVLYDFRIYDWSGVIYERIGLNVQEHKLETNLQPCKHYRWTVRARFRLNGAPRVTEWAGAFNTMGGEVAPWWWRRGSKPALAMSPENIFYYPIIETHEYGGPACHEE